MVDITPGSKRNTVSAVFRWKMNDRHLCEQCRHSGGKEDDREWG